MLSQSAKDVKDMAKAYYKYKAGKERTDIEIQKLATQEKDMLEEKFPETSGEIEGFDWGGDDDESMPQVNLMSASASAAASDDNVNLLGSRKGRRKLANMKAKSVAIQLRRTLSTKQVFACWMVQNRHIRF